MIICINYRANKIIVTITNLSVLNLVKIGLKCNLGKKSFLKDNVPISPRRVTKLHVVNF